MWTNQFQSTDFHASLKKILVFAKFVRSVYSPSKQVRNNNTSRCQDPGTTRLDEHSFLFSRRLRFPHFLQQLFIAPQRFLVLLLQVASLSRQDLHQELPVLAREQPRGLLALQSPQHAPLLSRELPGLAVPEHDLQQAALSLLQLALQLWRAHGTQQWSGSG